VERAMAAIGRASNPPDRNGNTNSESTAQRSSASDRLRKTNQTMTASTATSWRASTDLAAPWEASPGKRKATAARGGYSKGKSR